MSHETGLFIMAVLGSMVIYWTTMPAKVRILIGMLWVGIMGSYSYGIYFTGLMLWILFNVLLYWGKTSIKALFYLNAVTVMLVAAYLFYTFLLMAASVSR